MVLIINIKNDVWIHCGIKLDVFKPEEIATYVYIQSKGYFTWPYCDMQLFLSTKNKKDFRSVKCYK